MVVVLLGVVRFVTLFWFAASVATRMPLRHSGAVAALYIAAAAAAEAILN